MAGLVEFVRYRERLQLSVNLWEDGVRWRSRQGACRERLQNVVNAQTSLILAGLQEGSDSVLQELLLLLGSSLRCARWLLAASAVAIVVVLALFLVFPISDSVLPAHNYNQNRQNRKTRGRNISCIALLVE